MYLLQKKEKILAKQLRQMITGYFFQCNILVLKYIIIFPDQV